MIMPTGQWKKQMVNKFVESTFFEKLDKRKDGFKFIVDHLSKLNDGGTIIETGTARIKDNWDGDGQSTLIWDWCIDQDPKLKAISIDLSQEYVDISKGQTKHIDYICDDSISALSKLPDSVLNDTKLLYLDSYDWSIESHMESCFHHMCEFATVWRALPEGCLVVVDDRHDQFMGKHVLIQYFFDKLGKEPAFVGYQIGWLK